MISTAAIWTTILLSFSALVGLLTLQWVLRHRDDQDPINKRFRFGIRVIMVIFVGRILMVLTGAMGFRFLVLLGAALIPLAVLLLTEGLLRRHARQAAKTGIAAGTVFFALTAFWHSDSIDPARLVGLLVFQVIGFCLSGWMVLTRDRASLTAAENMTITRLGMSLILLIPLVIADYLLLYFNLPVQFSAIGVLILCWLAIGLGRAHQGHRATLIAFVLTVSAACAVGIIIGALTQAGRDGTMMVTALILALMLLTTIVQDARRLRTAEQSLGLLRHMATAQAKDPLVFLRDLQAHPLVEGAVIINEDSLKGLQWDTLETIFAAAPVLRRANPPALGPQADDHISYLFDRYGATHIMLACPTPRVLIALSMPSLSLSSNAELELEVVQRMAALISERRT